MARCVTRYFGETEYEESAILRFPAGLPGFEGEREFLAIEQPEQRPLVFLQSLSTPELCFVTLPVFAIDRNYRLEITEADRELAGFRPNEEIRIGENAACLAILTIEESGVTANLLGPVVINLTTRLAVQAVAPQISYSHRTPLPFEGGARAGEAPGCCS